MADLICNQCCGTLTSIVDENRRPSSSRKEAYLGSPVPARHATETPLLGPVQHLSSYSKSSSSQHHSFEALDGRRSGVNPGCDFLRLLRPCLGVDHGPLTCLATSTSPRDMGPNLAPLHLCDSHPVTQQVDDRCSLNGYYTGPRARSRTGPQRGR
jgi:hypothetical protein